MLEQSESNFLHRNADWLENKYWNEELSSTEMAALAGVQKCTILRWMNRYGIFKRTPGEALTLKNGYAQYKNRVWLWEHYVEKGLNTYQIADQIGCGFQTVCRWLDEFGIPRRDWVAQFRYENREHSWNDKFFDVLTPDSAYIIGMIIADGSLSGSDTKQYSIQIVQKDRGILDKISAVVSGGKFHRVSEAWSLCLNSKHAHEVLMRQYSLPNGREKSCAVRIPDCILERDDLLPHCIRGIFDGDGSVIESGARFGFCSGSLGLLNDIVDVLMRLVSLPNVEACWASGGYIKKNGERSGAYYIDYCGVLDTIDFARFIYGLELDVYGSTLYLEKKRGCFQSVCDRWHGRKWLCKQIEEGKTNKDIAIELGISRHRVTKVLNGIGVYDFPYKNPEWLWNAIEVYGRSLKSVGEEFSVRNDEIKYYCDKYDIAYIFLKKVMPKEIDDPNWLTRKYWEENLSMKEMATFVDVAYNTIINRMNKYNIPRRHTKWNLELGI